ncbi:MAG TPA: retropepsin-like aspartic protease [Acidobacteriaceae bacterium]|nr:retropepsin-like aspartic protease [Acidobacteriaceae bacterium]
MAKSSKLGLWSLPIEANTKQAEWVLDTGMTFSTVTESEAKRVGLTLLDSGGRGSSGHTARELPIRLAIATDLRIGSAHLRNVVFAVVADNALNFGSDRLRGIIGLPAIRALGSIAVSARGMVRIHSDSTKPRSEPNMFFDGLTPIVEAIHAGRAVPMTLDTGGTTTYLYSSFREILTPEERAKLSRQNRRFGGVGGSIKIETELLPKLELELPGRTVGLIGVALRSDTNPFSDGLLGIDALKGGFAIDFNTMRLELD